MATNYLTSSRHGTVYYFRRRVPDELRKVIGKPYLVKSLRTHDRGRATILARAYAATSDAIFQTARNMKNKSDEGIVLDYSFELELDSDGTIRKIKVDATPDESDAVNANIQTALANLPRIAGVPLGQENADRALIISADELYKDFFNEGVALKRWRNPKTTRQHDYDPIWKRFSVHAATHGLTLAAVKSYRIEILGEDVAINTKIRNLSRIHAVIAHGIANHQLEERMLKPLKLSAAASKASGGKTTSYLPFTSEELIALFQSESYRNNTFKKPSQFWLPLIGLYTGARIDELAGLSLSAFRVEDGYHAVMLSDLDTTDGGKNEHAPRLMPIHQTLISLGLLAYVTQLKNSGFSRLFPDIGEATRDGFGKRATDDFIKYRRSVGVGKEKGTRSRQVFHSFRSGIAIKFYQLGIDGDLARRLTGHAAIDVHEGTYLAAAAIPMARAAEAFSKVSFGLIHSNFFDTKAYIKVRNRAKSR